MIAAEKPILIFDGKCGFCRIWIEYWKQRTGDAIEYAASQDVGGEYPQIAPEEFGRSVQLVLPDGEVFRGADAVFRTLAFGRWPVWMYRHVPGFAWLTESAYRAIAAHRDVGYWVTVLLFGHRVEPLTYGSVERVFCAALSAIWLVAFVSFGVQALGLIGERGVAPVAEYLPRVREYLGERAVWLVPSVLWVHSSDAAIQAVWMLGALCASLALVGVFRRAALFGTWLLYLSLMNVSQGFLGYQWDMLLLEAGFLTVFVGYSRVVVWLFRWLLFRLMFLSGAVKLLSGDATWWGLNALFAHFETQPIPTPLAWYAHQLPGWFLRASTGAVLFVELAIALLVLGPRRLRLLAAPFLVGLQVLILLTGNYAFFNWLALALCLFLFDDLWLGRWMRWRPVVVARPRVAWAVAVVVLLLSGSWFWRTLTSRLPPVLEAVVSRTAAFGISSGYGLFASMTTVRPEIVLEGSNDGSTWQAYEFRYKAGRLDRRPPMVAPHQPRLDWQMWFAAYGTHRQNPWFVNLVARLLEGSPRVLGLLERNPFPDAPPKFIRAQLYEYRFTTWGQNDWWTRRLVGLYLPPVSRKSEVEF